MRPAGNFRGGDSIKPQVQPAVDTDQKIQQWVRLVEDGAPKEEVDKAEQALAQALNARPFEIKQNLPFFQRMAKALHGGEAFQQFRLTGGQVVVDRRDKEAESGKPTESKDSPKAEQRKAEAEAHRLKEGKLIREKGGIGVRDSLASGGLERQAASDRVDKFLSAFERMIIARFEDGKQIASQTKDGQPVFQEKSEAQWKEFFQNFLSRTVQRSAKLEDIRNFLFRGLVSKGDKGIFIGDMCFNNGRVEKFIRLSIIAQILAKLKGTKPGETLLKELLSDMSKEELVYLALDSAKRRRFDLAQKATEGKFMGGRAEDRASKELGLALESQLREKAKSLRGRGARGGFGSFFDRDPEADDLPYRFVPWWHWGNLTRPGKFKWVTTFFYFALLTLAIMGIILVTMRILSGS